jgi:GH15 family glucan-1,4-alpha-glucosidase
MAPIEDYALLGDLHTAALLSRDGSIDWMCLPRFDSGACFAALLQDESAGHWRLAPACGGLATRRSYRDDTLIMDTEWDTPEGSVRVTDLMCRGRHPTGRDHPALVRLVEGLSGRVPMRMKLVMRLDYGQVVPWVRRRDGGLSALAGPDMLWLDTPVPTDGRPPKGPGVKSSDMYTVADFPVAAGDKVPFVLSHTPWPHRPERIDAESALQETEAFWTNWISCCNYRGRWEAPVRRALITGLPILLAAGRHLHTAGLAWHRVPQRGRRMAGVAGAGRRR